MARYKGVKGKYWTLLSTAIRERDHAKYKRCISCGKKIDKYRTVKGDAGHYAPAGNCGFAMRFDPKNIHLECTGCNRFDHGHLIRYRHGLVLRYGEDFAVELDERYRMARTGQTITKEWSKLEWEREYDKLKADPQEYVKITT